jgi:hypothetical protein
MSQILSDTVWHFSVETHFLLGTLRHSCKETFAICDEKLAICDEMFAICDELFAICDETFEACDESILSHFRIKTPRQTGCSSKLDFSDETFLSTKYEYVHVIVNYN